MPGRKSPQIPSYRLHKPTGLAVVRLSGKDFYLGKHGSLDSKNKYERLIAEWIANHRQLHPDGNSGSHTDFTVAELFLSYWRHAELHYRKNGRPTSQLGVIKLAARPLIESYGSTSVSLFGPSALRAIREKMIDTDSSRKTINKLISVIKQMFKWGAENELIAASIYSSLQTVSGLCRGRVLVQRELGAGSVPLSN